MESEKKMTDEEVEAQIATIEDAQQARLADLKKQERRQTLEDLKAREQLAEEHGEDAIAGVRVSKYRPGYPVTIYVKRPTRIQYKRYTDQVGKGVQKKDSVAAREAQDLLATTCWVYPLEPDQRKAMLEEFSGILSSIILAATRLAEGAEAEEGKG